MKGNIATFKVLHSNWFVIGLGLFIITLQLINLLQR